LLLLSGGGGGKTHRYYAATAALRTGVDLATVYCAEEAAIPIKCYSPELMVQPIYRAQTISSSDDPAAGVDVETEIHAMVQAVAEGMEYMHCLLIGPGLGRSAPVLDAVQRIITMAIAKRKFLVLDADALFLLSHYKNLLQGYDRVVLTPNAVELQRLQEAGILELARDAIIVQKGHYDVVSRNGTAIIQCTETGGLKRPGGIGDVLAGTIAALVSWHALLVPARQGDLALSCWTACCIVKRATAKAYARHGRAMSAQDVIGEIGPVFQEMVE
jgi:ATP-dependent NAD(P)H-hydrate dehydratase